jgi:hypothetical protein
LLGGGTSAHFPRSSASHFRAGEVVDPVKHSIGKIKKKNLVYTFELSQKFDFQSSTVKPDNKRYPIIKTGQI